MGRAEEILKLCELSEEITVKKLTSLAFAKALLKVAAVRKFAEDSFFFPSGISTALDGTVSKANEPSRLTKKGFLKLRNVVLKGLETDLNFPSATKLYLKLSEDERILVANNLLEAFRRKRVYVK